MKQGLLNKIAVLGKELPLNTLDELIDKFGGPEKVSEVIIYVIFSSGPRMVIPLKTKNKVVLKS